MAYNYQDKLTGDDKTRYMEKLKDIGRNQCPYRIRADRWRSNPKEWPSMEYAQLFNYLIKSPSTYKFLCVRPI